MKFDDTLRLESLKPSNFKPYLIHGFTHCWHAKKEKSSSSDNCAQTLHVLPETLWLQMSRFFSGLAKLSGPLVIISKPVTKLTRPLLSHDKRVFASNWFWFFFYLVQFGQFCLLAAKRRRKYRMSQKINFIFAGIRHAKKVLPCSAIQIARGGSEESAAHQTRGAASNKARKTMYPMIPD